MDLGFGIFIARMGLGSRAWGLGLGFQYQLACPGLLDGSPAFRFALGGS